MIDVDAETTDASTDTVDCSAHAKGDVSLTSRQRRALEAERDFLLGSIRDLDEQHESGELTDDRYESLLAGYTYRTARVLRILESAPNDSSHDPPQRPRASRRWRSRLAVILPLVAVVVLIAVLLPSAVRDRGDGDTITGNAQSRDTGTGLANAVEERPDDPTARRLYASYLLERGQLVDALTQYDAAASLDRSDAESRAYGGWIVFLAGITDDALTRIDDAIAADPTYPDAHAFRGLILAREGSKPAEAIKELTRFLDLAPPNAPMRSQVEALIARLQTETGTGE